jgi:3-oxoacyl-[acyl-carrier-protein] synthase III
MMIGSIRYVLGERRLRYEAAPSFERTLQRHKLPRDPASFGWGHYFETDRTMVDLATECAAQSLVASGLAPSDVDLVILCSTDFGPLGGPACERLYHQVLSRLSLSRAFVAGVTFNNCTNLLFAIDSAEALVQAGRYENVLIISSDKLPEEQIRFTHWCLFSDSAVSLVVSRDESPGFRVVGSSFGSDHRLVHEQSAMGDVELFRRVHEGLCRKVHLDHERVRCVLTSNLFLPLVRVKETSLGFGASRLYLENTVRLGHCFSADSLISLEDCCASRPATRGEQFLLTSYSPGVRAETLLEYS